MSESIGGWQTRLGPVADDTALRIRLRSVAAPRFGLGAHNEKLRPAGGWAEFGK